MASNLLDRFAVAMATQLLERSTSPGHDVWPEPMFHPAEANEYVYVPFFLLLDLMLNRLERQGYNDQELAELFISPSRIAHITYLFPGIRCTSLRREKAVDLCLKVLKYMACFRTDPFCPDGTNRLWSKSHVQKESENLIRLEPTQECMETRMLIGKLNAILFSYTELIYFCHHSFGHEFHGPYLVEGEKVIVREYFDLKPEFWRFSEDLPFEKLKFTSRYSRSSGFFIDFTGRLISTNLRKTSLKSYSLTVDNGVDKTSLNGVRETLDRLTRVIDKGIETILRLEKEELIAKYAEAYFHILKPLGLKAKMRWAPPSSLFLNIKEGVIPKALKPEFFAELSKFPSEEQMKRLMRAFDPRAMS
jgi:hypothetical protein